MSIRVKLEPAKRGDKWQGIPTIGPVTVNGSPPTFPLSRIRAHFRKSGVVGMMLDSHGEAGSHSIIITNADTWLAHVPEIQPLPLDSGDWEWDMEFWEGNDTAPQTFYSGTLRVTNDVTK